MFCAALLYVICAAIGLIVLLYGFQRVRKLCMPPASAHGLLTVCVVLGSGGHTAEMLRLVSQLAADAPAYARRHYVLADTDNISERKVHQFEQAIITTTTGGSYTLHRIPRSREVRQSYLSSVYTTLRSVMYSLPLMYRMAPDVLLVNGPGTCIPICLIVYLLDLFLIKSNRIIFIESICRVRSLSLTGVLCYYLPLADVCILQWPQLQLRYPRAIHLGRF